jgi:hypothetical protein
MQAVAQRGTSAAWWLAALCDGLKVFVTLAALVLASIGLVGGIRCRSGPTIYMSFIGLVLNGGFMIFVIHYLASR